MKLTTNKKFKEKFDNSPPRIIKHIQKISHCGHCGARGHDQRTCPIRLKTR